jgi:hypothetical protein
MIGNQIRFKPNFEFGIFRIKSRKWSEMVGKCLNRFLLLHLKYENESENGEVEHKNANLIG